MTRSTGLVALVLLSAAVVLGMLSSARFARPGWPRFVTSGLHRNISLLALTFTGMHVATTLLDSYTSISPVAALVPFSSYYHRFWLGLGTIALDLFVALIATSMLRIRLGYRAWRVVHWAAYACWPVAVLHAFGIGTDAARHWMLTLLASCAAAVFAAAAWRHARRLSREPR